MERPSQRDEFLRKADEVTAFLSKNPDANVGEQLRAMVPDSAQLQAIIAYTHMQAQLKVDAIGLNKQQS